MKIEDCIKELKIHGLVEDAEEGNGEKKYFLSDNVVRLIREAFRVMREEYPEATEEDTKIRALTFIVLCKMGMVFRKSLPEYVNVLSSLTEHSFLWTNTSHRIAPAIRPNSNFSALSRQKITR